MRKLLTPIFIVFLLFVLLGLPLINILGTPFAHKIGTFLGLFLQFIGIRRSIVQENIELAFSEEKGVEERKKLERSFYIYFGKSIIDTMRSLVTSKIPLDIRKDTKEKLMKIYNSQDEGFLVLSCHTGNWEQARSHMASFFPLFTVAKNQHNFLAQLLISRQRNKFKGKGGILYHPNPGNILQETKTLIAQKNVVAFMIDQHYSGRSAIRVNFFGTPCAMTGKIADFIVKNKIRTIATSTFYDSQGSLFFEIIDEYQYQRPKRYPKGSKEAELEETYLNTQAITHLIEKLIRKHPEQWLWMHRRWKADRTPIKIEDIISNKKSMGESESKNVKNL